MRKWHALLVGSLLLVSACTPVFDNKDEVIQETKDKDSNQAIIPNHSISEETYRMILSEDRSKVSKARSVTVNQMGNRMDISEFEQGLRRHSKEYYDPEEYFFQPGQFLSGDTVFDWLGRYDERHNEGGLNPELIEDEATAEQFRENPKYISN
ncbi:MAG: CamS family sex pheromone protein, partial [Halobacillus sp.]